MYFCKADFRSGVAVNQNAQSHKISIFFSTLGSFVNINGSSSDLW